MQDQIVSKQDSPDAAAPRFNTIERLVLVSAAFILTAWIGGLAWVGYKLVTFII